MGHIEGISLPQWKAQQIITLQGNGARYDR